MAVQGAEVPAAEEIVVVAAFFYARSPNGPKGESGNRETGPEMIYVSDVDKTYLWAGLYGPIRKGSGTQKVTEARFRSILKRTVGEEEEVVEEETFLDLFVLRSSMDGGVRARSVINADSGATGPNHGRENTQKRPLMGSSVRRNRLSDITNTVGSAGIGISRTSCSDDDKENADVMPSPRPKDCISQLMKVHDFCLSLQA
ncbi:hypothetical protein BHE74_00046336 [Ensete ventricosum]|nr:hypothetical protein BHE74_00046336 [Ensete ventricosum]